MKMLEDRIRKDGIVREGNVLKVKHYIMGACGARPGMENKRALFAAGEPEAENAPARVGGYIL